jgi:acylphosphatase
VRNRPDGSVEAMVHGEPDAVAQMLQWAHHGPGAARVAQVEEHDSAGVFERFDIVG